MLKLLSGFAGVPTPGIAGGKLTELAKGLTGAAKLKPLLAGATAPPKRLPLGAPGANCGTLSLTFMFEFVLGGILLFGAAILRLAICAAFRD